MTHVLGVHLAEGSLESATAKVLEWASAHESRSVFVANVHMIMEAFDSAAVRSALQEADMVVPDGVPLVWMMRLKGAREQARVYGPALMQQTLHAAAGAGHSGWALWLHDGRVDVTGRTDPQATSAPTGCVPRKPSIWRRSGCS